MSGRCAVPRGLAAAAMVALAACQPPLRPLVTAPTPAPFVRPADTTPADAATPVAALPILAAPSADPALTYLRSRRLMVPVAGAGPLDVSDTFDHPRSGERVHRAVDVLAPRGTPVLAADDGVVLAVRENRLGGKVVYCSDPEGRLAYYYAHLDRWADGLRVGQRVRQGDVLGVVGTTGNAPPDVPHLHFQVLRLTDRTRYWDGPVLDPRPYFTRDGEPAR